MSTGDKSCQGMLLTSPQITVRCGEMPCLILILKIQQKGLKLC
nr:MAG TPA: hypothetical protein [Caudoviricetes sp.]